MFKKLLVFLVIFPYAAFAEPLNSQAEIWNSTEGLKRLENSQFKNDFYQLLNFYQPQINPVYCSIASAVIILNALDYDNIPSAKEFEIHRPQSAGGKVSEFHLYTQQTFLNEKTDKIKKREVIEFKAPKQVVDGKEIYDAGLSLKDYSQILFKVYGLKVKLTYAKKNDEESVGKFRETLKKVLIDKKNFIIANFDGQLLGLKVSGHISPLVAYDEASDSVLILDVALHKNLWHFVNVERLFAAMNSKDDETYRGYLVVGR
jgi:hypothetical protein